MTTEPALNSTGLPYNHHSRPQTVCWLSLLAQTSPSWAPSSRPPLPGCPPAPLSPFQLVLRPHLPHPPQAPETLFLNHWNLHSAFPRFLYPLGSSCSCCLAALSPRGTPTPHSNRLPSQTHTLNKLLLPLSLGPPLLSLPGSFMGLPLPKFVLKTHCAVRRYAH